VNRRCKLYGVSKDTYPMYCTITCNINNYYSSSSSNINNSNSNDDSNTNKL